MLQCGDDDVVPDRARLGAQDVAVDADAYVASRTTVRPGVRRPSRHWSHPRAPTAVHRPESSFSALITAMIASVGSQVIMRPATGPTRRVVSGASGTSSAMGTPPISELTTGGNGSLASYAALIRHVRRVRGQRRTGPPRIQRSDTGSRDWPIPAPTGRRWIRWRRTTGRHPCDHKGAAAGPVARVVPQFHPGDL